MRISDWSSDVCSSDLLRRLILEGRAHLRAIDVGQLAIDLAGLLRLVELHQRLPQPIKAVGRAIPPGVVLIIGVERLHRHGGLVIRQIGAAKRSEEHTSELPSLMRISYAVFCLQKKLE